MVWHWNDPAKVCDYEASDSLTIYRDRSVTCPSGWYYSASLLKCKRTALVDPAKNNNVCPAGDGGTNPINAAAGYKLHRVNIFTLPVIGAFDLLYSSNAYLALGSATGWSNSYSKRVVESVPVTGITTVWLYRENGDRLPFNLIDDVYIPEPDITLALSKMKDVNGGDLGWVVRTAENVEETYDLDGRLIQLDGPGRQTVRLDHSAYGLSTIRAAGRQVNVTYNSARQLSSIALPDGSGINIEYGPTASVSSIVWLDGGAEIARKTYVYENSSYPEALTGIVDEQGNRSHSWGYDATGRANLSAHGSPQSAVDRVALTFNTDGTTRVVDALGEVRDLAFTYSHGVARAATSSSYCPSCGGASESISYDASGFRDVVMDFNGTSTDYSHNARGLVIQSIESANKALTKRTTQTDWHPIFASPVERRTYDSSDALVATQTLSYNTRGQRLTSSQIDPTTGTTRTTTAIYCEQADIDAGACPLLGLVKSFDGPRTDVVDVTSYAYRMMDEASCVTSPTTCPYRRGDLWKITNALGQVSETLQYDAAGRPLSVRGPNGVITDMEYHPRGWLTARKVRGADDGTESDDHITRIEYEPTGLVKKTTLPDGSYTSFTYDAAHRLTDISDGAGNRIHYTLNNAGDKTKEETIGHNGSVLRVLSRVYNQLGQLQASKDAYEQGITFTYDANGNPKTTTDPMSRVSSNDYDPLNRLVQTIQDLGGIDATTRFEYDAFDNLTAVTDPKGLTTRYRYNSFGDLKELISPDTGVTTYTYDKAGNRASQVDARNVQTFFSYDALSRLTEVVYPTPSLNATYTYDVTPANCEAGEQFSVGRLTHIQDGSGTTRYCYNRFGQMVRKVQVTNSREFVLRYAYTKSGQVSAISYPDGTVADYQYDPLGRATEVGVTRSGQLREVLLTSISHHAFGPIAGWTFGNGRDVIRALDQNYQPGVIQDSAGELSLGFEFDPAGNLSALFDGALADPPKALYDYDGLNRLTQVKDGPTSAPIDVYGYDATGNRTSVSRAGTTVPYTYATDSHRLMKVGTADRLYNAVGSTTAINGAAKEFGYDASGRLEKVTVNGAEKLNYVYNGKGEQVRRYLGTANVYTLYNEVGQWMGEYSNDGAALQQVIWLGDLPVGVVSAGKLHYIEADHLGSPRVIVDPVRNVAIWKWELVGEVFGETPPKEDVDGDGQPFVFNLRFPGQRYDAASGLNYNYFRDYEPGTGRYAQSDPLGNSDGPSTYGYVRQNPLGLIDTHGNSARPGAAQNFKQLAEQARAEATAKMRSCKEGDCAQVPDGYNFNESDRQATLANLAMAQIVFDGSSGDCGSVESVLDPNVITIGAPTLSGRCCSLAAVLAHEAMHLGRDGRGGRGTEERARYIQQRCFGCTTAFK